MTRVAFSPDGRLVAAAGRDGSARIYHVGSGKYARRLDAGRAPLASVAFSARTGLLATASADGSLLLWDVEAGAVAATIRAVAGSAGAYVFTTDGAFEWLGEPASDVAPVCRVGPRSYPFALCAERASTKGLLKKLLAGDASSREP